MMTDLSFCGELSLYRLCLQFKHTVYARSKTAVFFLQCLDEDLKQAEQCGTVAIRVERLC